MLPVCLAATVLCSLRKTHRQSVLFHVPIGTPQAGAQLVLPLGFSSLVFVCFLRVPENSLELAVCSVERHHGEEGP